MNAAERYCASRTMREFHDYEGEVSLAEAASLLEEAAWGELVMEHGSESAAWAAVHNRAKSRAVREQVKSLFSVE